MLEKPWYDGKAADDETDRDFDVGPQAHDDHVVAHVRVFYDLPRVVCAYY